MDEAGDRVITGHGGTIALEALVGFGVGELFTLSGGHVFPLYDAAVRVVDPPVRLVDVRHDVFEPGCWLDAGPYGCLG
ncbi:MAG: hypothetical protein WKF93_07765, partial [Acidimicrobiales bacterium]